MSKLFIQAIFLLLIGLIVSYGDDSSNAEEELLQDVLQMLKNDEVSGSQNGKIIRIPESLRSARILSIFNQSFNELLTSRYRWPQGQLSQTSFSQSPRTGSGTRLRRSLILPGTNYCGVGNDTTDVTVVGDMSGPDRCCREHDTCPYTIQGFQTKYNLYNFRFYTVSHCECDDIFRTCLRMADSEQANIVGRLYFNYIGMKCFEFRRETVCAEREWWGRCKRQEIQVKAKMRDPLQY